VSPNPIWQALAGSRAAASSHEVPVLADELPVFLMSCGMVRGGTVTDLIADPV
jgi:hypothetical protein